jgi:Domain of unknown function (DUF1841)
MNMALFNPTRDQVRQFFFDTWVKFNANQMLTDIEAIAMQVIQMHPEYHAVLNAPERYKGQAYFPEMGETNPFLHMSLHISVLEQVAINQPIGIRSAYQALKLKHGNESDAQHDLMDCLAETVWQAQRESAPPNAEAYIACIQAKASS